MRFCLLLLPLVLFVTNAFAGSIRCTDSQGPVLTGHYNSGRLGISFSLRENGRMVHHSFPAGWFTMSGRNGHLAVLAITQSDENAFHIFHASEMESMTCL
jgi:hypothetical protein